jgi:hypothetical protein
MFMRNFGAITPKQIKGRSISCLTFFECVEPVDISAIDRLSPRLAKAYADLHPRTCIRDVETFENKNFLVRERKRIRANTALIARFSAPIRTRAHQAENSETEIPPEVADLIGGGGWTRTNDLRIMRCAFGKAATWIQSLAFGIRDLSWSRVQTVSA